jgi:hypothetical protein
MRGAYLAALLVLGACTASQGTQSSAVCDPVVSLGGNAADFQTMASTDDIDQAYAAIDRMSNRTRSAVAALQAVEGPAGAEAERLAAIEQELLPILDQFRAARDQTSWTSARTAYTNWYNRSLPVLTETVEKLADLGVQCG